MWKEENWGRSSILCLLSHKWYNNMWRFELCSSEVTRRHHAHYAHTPAGLRPAPPPGSRQPCAPQRLSRRRLPSRGTLLLLLPANRQLVRGRGGVLNVQETNQCCYLKIYQFDNVFPVLLGNGWLPSWAGEQCGGARHQAVPPLGQPLLDRYYDVLYNTV